MLAEAICRHIFEPGCQRYLQGPHSTLFWRGGGVQWEMQEVGRRRLRQLRPPRVCVQPRNRLPCAPSADTSAASQYSCGAAIVSSARAGHSRGRAPFSAVELPRAEWVPLHPLSGWSLEDMQRGMPNICSFCYTSALASAAQSEEGFFTPLGRPVHCLMQRGQHNRGEA